MCVGVVGGGEELFATVLITQDNTDQFSRGQTTLLALAEQVKRQLQGQRTYFFPRGGGAMGYIDI